MERLKWQVYGITYKKCVLKNKNQIIDGVIPTNFATPILVGDYVRIEAKNDVFVVKKVLPRKNELIRPKCANVDVVLIIYPVDKLKKCHDLLWMIMMYQSQGQMVRVIFSKTDLYGVPTGIIYELLYQLGVRYHCYRESDELDFLCELLKKQFVVLSGYSGAGKSTFMNYLDNNLQLKTNPLTAKNTGKHTTTTSCIYEVKNIKWIDTPGFGSLHFTPSKQTIATGWMLWSILSWDCKFSDCLHNQENKNCAIYKKVQEGTITKELYDIYLHLLKQGK